MSSFSDEFSLPFESSNSLYYNNNLELFLSKYKTEAYTILDILKAAEIISETEKFRHRIEIEQNINSIIEIINDFLNYQRLSSISKFDTLLHKNKANIYALNNVHESNSLELYRVRLDKGFKKDKIANEKYSLFHIPFNKRYLVSSGRFNPQGFPCFYTANSFDVAFKEVLNSTKQVHSIKEYLNVGIFKNNTIVNVIDFSLKDINLLLQNTLSDNSLKNQLLTYLNLYPIIASCHSKINYNTLDYINFKIEHLFPSLVIDWFLKLYNSIEKTDLSSRPYFLKYSSVRSSSPSKAHNYAFFTQPFNGKDEYCPHLASIFIENKQHIYNSDFNKFHINNFSHKSSHSNFQDLTEYLKRKIAPTLSKVR